MTGMFRFSWLAELGAPSRSGVRLPETDGFKMFCIEKILSGYILWGKVSKKSCPKLIKITQKFL